MLGMIVLKFDDFEIIPNYFKVYFVNNYDHIYHYTVV